jgi:hypothetical protein
VLHGHISYSQLLQIWIVLYSGKLQGNEKIHKNCSSNGKTMHEVYIPSTKNNMQTKLMPNSLQIFTPPNTKVTSVLILSFHLCTRFPFRFCNQDVA